MNVERECLVDRCVGWEGGREGGGVEAGRVVLLFLYFGCEHCPTYRRWCVEVPKKKNYIFLAELL